MDTEQVRECLVKLACHAALRVRDWHSAHRCGAAFSGAPVKTVAAAAAQPSSWSPLSHVPFTRVFSTSFLYVPY